jgi:hypothetical protein
VKNKTVFIGRLALKVNQPYMCEDLRAGFNEAKMGMNWAGDSRICKCTGKNAKGGK